jgi:uncharacterized protein (DUF111 family)
MKLLIDGYGGIAGDMFSAAMISAGVEFNTIKKVMLKAANKLGTAQIDIQKTQDNSRQLTINLDSQRNHLKGSEAKDILIDLFKEFSIKDIYQKFGFRILDILLKAETRAHAEFNIVVKDGPDHHHGEEDHHHGHHTHDHVNNDAFLHEAQDIVIDIMGAVAGIQKLKIDPSAQLLGPVSVGGGFVDFSHGKLPVPAPATKIILEQYQISYQKGPVDVELCTPTGAAILAALNATGTEFANINDYQLVAQGKSRGTKILNIPPLKIFICKKTR